MSILLNGCDCSIKCPTVCSYLSTESITGLRNEAAAVVIDLKLQNMSNFNVHVEYSLLNYFF